jgi:hypothetical protein
MGLSLRHRAQEVFGVERGDSAGMIEIMKHVQSIEGEFEVGTITAGGRPAPE